MVSWRGEVLKGMTDQVGDCQLKEIHSGVRPIGMDLELYRQ